MEKTRGIVMKVSNINTVIYTEQGDYLEIKTPKLSPFLGQVIEIDLPVRKTYKRRFSKALSFAAIILLALGLGAYNILSSTNAAVAAVVLDINSSKELFVNRDAKVLKVVDLEQGTETIRSKSQLQGKDIYTSVNLILDDANSQGIFRQNNNMVMASIIPLDSSQADIVDQTKLRNSIGHHMLENNLTGDVMVSKTDQSTQKTAQSLGMSINQYLVYQRLIDQGLLANQSNPSSDNTSHMLTEASTTISSLFPHESMTIMPQAMTNQEMSKSSGTSRSGERTPAMSSQKSVTSPNPATSQGQSQQNMMNPSPSSNSIIPVTPPMSNPANIMPKQNSSGSSGKNGMMP